MIRGRTRYCSIAFLARLFSSSCCICSHRMNLFIGMLLNVQIILLILQILMVQVFGHFTALCELICVKLGHFLRFVLILHRYGIPIIGRFIIMWVRVVLLEIGRNVHTTSRQILRRSSRGDFPVLRFGCGRTLWIFEPRIDIFSGNLRR